MTKQNIFLLKTTIEMYDRAIFPEKPARIFLGKDSSNKEILASFGTRHPKNKFSLFAGYILLVILLFIVISVRIVRFPLFVLTSLILKLFSSPKSQRDFRRKKIVFYYKNYFLFQRCIEHFYASFYRINTRTTYPISSIQEILAGAAHEVVHRVQAEKRFRSNQPMEYLHMKKTFLKAEIGHIYAPEDIEDEIEARIIEEIIYEKALFFFINHPNPSLSEIQDFINLTKDVLVTRYENKSCSA